MRKLLIILGVPIDDLTMTTALTRIDDFITTGRRHGKGRQIATINADFVVKAQKDPELRQILQECDMTTADGMPLVWGARLLGVPLTERVTGADLVPALAARAAQENYTIFLLGAAPKVAARAAKILEENNPGLNIVGVLSPPKASVLEMDPTIIETVRAARPDILLVAFGNPKQEKWIAMHAPQLQTPVMIGIGGTLDFIAGQTKRAPVWMQRAGLEWLFRLAHEPRRLWRRYVHDMVGFGSFFLRQWWLMRQGNRPSPIIPRSSLVLMGQTAVLNVNGRLDRSNVTDFNNRCQTALTRAGQIVINLENAAFVDSTGLGALVGLHKQVRDAGKEMAITAVTPTVANAISLLRLDKLFTIHDTLDDAIAPQSGAAAPAPPAAAGKWRLLPMPARLDAHTAPATLAQARAQLQQHRWLVLDLSQTTFLASAGLAMMATLAKEAAAQDGEVRLAGAGRNVLQTLQLANFDRVLPIFSTPAAATD